jgi:small subunit ribosomal protein S21
LNSGAKRFEFFSHNSKAALHKRNCLCYKPPPVAPDTGSARKYCVQCNRLKGTINVQVVVRDNNVDQALRALKKKMQREGIFREMKLRRAFEKPSERKAREKAEAIRRHRKLMRKRKQREGY